MSKNLKTPKNNNPAQSDNTDALKRVRKSIYRQAALAGVTIVLMVVLLFAMTAAWYTNIVQTTDLEFTAATWGFEGTVNLDNKPIQAAPGDEGVIALTATNDSDFVTAVSVNISKAEMEPKEMQQRIYFYADTSKIRNGEVMDRVYLNNTDSYTYTMFSRGKLYLTETVHNDALLKWHWVYDVLGYYVQADWNPTAGTEGTMMSISEYLRPIEYNYHENTTTFDEDGNLLTIDGVTVKDFLADLSARDGYPGVINTDAVGDMYDGYYPVKVVKNEDGTMSGVWAYLCNLSEIEANTAYDTSLGSGSTEVTNPYQATITLYAQNSKVETVEVSTGTDLVNALASSDHVAIRLNENITVGQTLTIGSTKTVTDTNGTQTEQLVVQNVMLDLNGHTITLPERNYNNKESSIVVNEGSSLTIIGGGTTVQAEDGSTTTTKGEIVGKGGYLLTASGAEVTMSNVTVSGVHCALSVEDNKSTLKADSKIRLLNCEFDTTEEAIYIHGNGDASAQRTQLVVENSTIVSGYIGIMGSGNDDQRGTDVQIISSTVNGLWAGIYQPQGDSVLMISGNSSITGFTGLALKGGTTIVEDSTVSGTGVDVKAPAFSGSGFTDTGDGIYIETNYTHSIVLKIRGSSQVTSVQSQAVRVYDPNATNYSVTIYSGTFSSDVSKFVADTSKCVTSNGECVVSVTATETESTSTADDGEMANLFGVSDTNNVEGEEIDNSISSEEPAVTEPEQPAVSPTESAEPLVPNETVEPLVPNETVEPLVPNETVAVVVPDQTADSTAAESENGTIQEDEPPV